MQGCWFLTFYDTVRRMQGFTFSQVFGFPPTKEVKKVKKERFKCPKMTTVAYFTLLFVCLAPARYPFNGFSVLVDVAVSSCQRTMWLDTCAAGAQLSVVAGPSGCRSVSFSFPTYVGCENLCLWHPWCLKLSGHMSLLRRLRDAI